MSLSLGLFPRAADPERAEALRSEIGALEAAGAGEGLLTAPGGAFFSAVTDGWEALSPDAPEALTVGKLSAVLRAEALSSAGAGRLVTDGTWLLAALTDSFTVARFAPGTAVTVETEAAAFPAEVILVRVEDGRAAVIFRCREALEAVLCRRTLTAEVVTDRAEGLLLPEAALREEDGEPAVYRIAGRLLCREKVAVLRRLPGGVLVSGPGLREGDEVLLGDPEEAGKHFYLMNN